MKYFFLLILVYCNANAFGQQFRLFEWGTEHLYESTNGIKGMRVDSFSLAGGDTSFYNYFVIGQTADSNNCYDAFSPSWLGKRIIYSADTTCYIINANNDSILIRANDSIGSVWNIYSDSTYLITASISNLYPQTVNGLTDTIKEIILHEYLNNNSYIGIMDGKILKLSKHHGFFKTIPFLNFPDDSTSYTLNDNLFLTDSNVYNFDIGDTFQYESFFYPQYFGPNPPPSLPNNRTIVITNKTFLPNHQVEYEIWDDVFERWVTFDSLMLGHYHDTAIISTHTIQYSTLNTKIYTSMPEEADVDPNGNLLGRAYMGKYNNGCDIVSESFTSDDMYFDSVLNSICPYTFEVWLTEFQYETGLGLTYENHHIYHQNGNSTLNHLIAYHKSNCSYGTIIINGISNVNIEPAINIFPNPGTDNGTITITCTHKIAFLNISDITGKSLKKIFSCSDNINFPAESLNNGIYLFEIQFDDGNKVVKKYVRQ